MPQGCHSDISWMRLPVATEDGCPKQKRGVVADAPGRYFVGLPFLHALASLVGGVGKDAESVARHIASKARSRKPRQGSYA
jgi:putative flavoprotein involved in K+ transport